MTAVAPEVPPAGGRMPAAPPVIGHDREVGRAIRPGHPGPAALDQFCATDLCVSTPARPTRPVLHPFLRRILLDALAGRPGNDPDSWSAVNTRLRGYSLAERDDQPAALYHALALGDIAAVVAYLDAQLGTLDTARWLAELKTITRAPRVAQSKAPTPRDQVKDLVPDREPLARAVAAMWVGSDPLGDPHGTLDVRGPAASQRTVRRARVLPAARSAAPAARVAPDCSRDPSRTRDGGRRASPDTRPGEARPSGRVKPGSRPPSAHAGCAAACPSTPRRRRPSTRP